VCARSQRDFGKKANSVSRHAASIVPRAAPIGFRGDSQLPDKCQAKPDDFARISLKTFVRHAQHPSIFSNVAKSTDGDFYSKVKISRFRRNSLKTKNRCSGYSKVIRGMPHCGFAHRRANSARAGAALTLEWSFAFSSRED